MSETDYEQGELIASYEGRHSEANATAAEISDDSLAGPEAEVQRGNADELRRETARQAAAEQDIDDEEILEKRTTPKHIDGGDADEVDDESEADRARAEIGSAAWEKERNAELAERLGCEAGEIELHKSLRHFQAEDLANYCKRFQLTAEDLSDARTANLLKSKIDSDLYITKLKTGDAEDGDGDSGEEETETAEEEQKPAEETKPAEQNAGKPTDYPKTLAEFTPAHTASLTAEIVALAERTEKACHPAYLEAFARGMELSMQEDLKLDPSGRNMTNTVSTAAVAIQSMIESSVQPQVDARIEQYVRANFDRIFSAYAPEFRGMYTDAIQNNVWNRIAGNDLPHWDSAEFEEAAREVHANNPWINEATFPNKSYAQMLEAKAQIIAKAMREGKVDARGSYEKGRADADRVHRRVSAGRALGAGKSIGSMDRGERRTSLMDAYTERGHGNGGI